MKPTTKTAWRSARGPPASFTAPVRDLASPNSVWRSAPCLAKPSDSPQPLTHPPTAPPAVIVTALPDGDGPSDTGRQDAVEELLTELFHIRHPHLLSYLGVAHGERLSLILQHPGGPTLESYNSDTAAVRRQVGVSRGVVSQSPTSWGSPWCSLSVANKLGFPRGVVSQSPTSWGSPGCSQSVANYNASQVACCVGFTG